MLNLKSVESATWWIAIFLAYFFVATLTGAFRAWVARAMGDDTPEYMGFLTLNPMVHSDPIGFFFLMFFGFGWGKYIPINPFNITGKFRWLKISVAYFSSFFANIAMATVSLLILIVSFGSNVLNISARMMMYGRLFQGFFIGSYPDSSSLMIAIALFLSALMYLNVLLGVLNFIISGFAFFSMVFADRFEVFGKYRDILLILIPMFIIFFFAGDLRILVVYIITNIGYILAKMLGIP